MGGLMGMSIVLLLLVVLLINSSRIWHAIPAMIDPYHLSHSISATETNSTNLYDCAHHYTIAILSMEPLIFYINNFLKESEVRYLLQQSESKFQESPVYNEKLQIVIDKRFRTSESAWLDRNDPISMCLSQRMKSMLGNMQHIETEALQIVKYQPSQEFRVHMDWYDEPRNRTDNPKFADRSYNRLASIFAYLGDECEGGETFFPRVPGVSSVADGDKFSRTDTGQGLLVKPKRGNAIFWNNLLPNASGDPRVAHAGLPVHSGIKVGLNLFGHYFYDAPMIGGDEE